VKGGGFLKLSQKGILLAPVAGSFPRKGKHASLSVGVLAKAIDKRSLP